MKILEYKQATNTALAAAGSEFPITSTNNVDFYNELQVINGDAVTIRISLDNDSMRIYDVLSKTSMTIAAEEGLKFTKIKQTNQDAATAETAGAILFVAIKKE